MIPVRHLQASRLRPACRIITLRSQHASSTSKIQVTNVDQTKESNDVSKSSTDEHKAYVRESESDQGKNRQEQDPEQTPSRSTGIETKGKNGLAGEGENKGVTMDKGAGPYMKQ